MSFGALDAANLGTTLVVLGGTTRLAQNTAKGLPGDKKKRKSKKSSTRRYSKAVKRASRASRKPRRVGDYEITGRKANLLKF